MNDFITEVKEDLKRERFDKIFNKYGKTIVYMSVIVVLGVAAGSWYKKDRISKQEDAGNEYRFLIEDQGEDQMKALDAFIAKDSGGYNHLAAFTKAKTLFSKAKLDESIVAYDAIANNNAIDAHFRQLASYYAGMIELNQKKTTILEARLHKLATENDTTWKYSITELRASLAVEQGKIDEAIKQFTLLVDGTNVPNSIRTRAGKAISALKANLEVK